MKKLLGIFLFLPVVACSPRYESCVETFYKPQAEGGWIGKDASCTFGVGQPEQGYQKLNGQWYFVKAGISRGQCGFYKICRTDEREYYLLSNEQQGFQVLSKDYAKDSQQVFLKNELIKGADAATFRVINDNYTLDAKQVYFLGQSINNADPATFKAIEATENRYALDARSVFFEGELIERANPASFKVFQSLPKNMSANRWGYDLAYLYYETKQIPIAMDTANLKFVITNLWTDGKKVLDVSHQYDIKLRDDIKLPLVALTPYLVRDSKGHIFIRKDIGFVKEIQGIDGRSLKFIEPTCSVTEHPYFTLDCKVAKQMRKDMIYFEDSQQVYSLYYGTDIYGNLYADDPKVVFKRDDKPYYLFNIDGDDIMLHGDMLYNFSETFYYRAAPMPPRIRIEGKLIGPFFKHVLIDEAGFIQLQDYVADKDNWLERTFEKKDFGLIKFSKHQLKDTSYVLENDKFIFIFWANNNRDVIVDKQTKKIRYMVSVTTETEYMSDDLAESLLTVLEL